MTENNEKKLLNQPKVLLESFNPERQEDRKRILAEVEKSKTRKAGFDFNNLLTIIFKNKDKRLEFQEHGFMDKYSEQNKSPDSSKLSDVRLNLTNQEFFNIIDQRMEALGLVEEAERLKKLADSKDENFDEFIKGKNSQEIRRRLAENTEHYDRAMAQLQEHLIPLYVELRLMGFTPYDITC